MTWQGGGPLVVGVDLGGTKILAGVVSAENRILGRGKRDTPAREGGPAILQEMIACVDEALACAGIHVRTSWRAELARPVRSMSSPE